jgi:hypothetical protein
MSDQSAFMIVPIYWRSLEVHSNRNEEIRREWIERNLDNCVPTERAHRVDEAVLLGPWEFNEAAGWLRLQGSDCIVKGHLLWTGRRNIRERRLYSWQYRYPTKVLEVRFNRSDVADQIVSKLRERIIAVAAKQPGGRRNYADLEVFDRLAPCVDWRLLLGFDSVRRL